MATTQKLRGNYLLNTDGGMRSSGRRERGATPDLAAIGVVLRGPRLVTIATISNMIGPATHNVAEYRALIDRRGSPCRARRNRSLRIGLLPLRQEAI
jgi:hypothetical protein